MLTRNYGVWLLFIFLSVEAPGQARSSQWHSFKSSASYDAQAEAVLLEMANRARAEAGVPPLQLDEGLTKAASLLSQVVIKEKPAAAWWV